MGCAHGIRPMRTRAGWWIEARPVGKGSTSKGRRSDWMTLEWCGCECPWACGMVQDGTERLTRRGRSDERRTGISLTLVVWLSHGGQVRHYSLASLSNRMSNLGNARSAMHRQWFQTLRLGSMLATE